MTKALVLMKAMPFTKGHGALINFAESLADETTVIIDYSSGEPLPVIRRIAAEDSANRKSTGVVLIPVEPQSELEAENFWEIWENILEPYRGYDFVVGSEDYCKRVASIIGARFMPFDPYRELHDVKATDVRNDPLANYHMLSKFSQEYHRTRVTIFGAESTGKTTLTKALGAATGAPAIFEWARPYLETVGPDININAMNDIFEGQSALQIYAGTIQNDSPYIIHDTDLYTALGYWEQPHWEGVLGVAPRELRDTAYDLRSNLYLVTKSDIPFEPDPIRYGGDRRESSDEYWIDLLERNQLRYHVLEATDPQERLTEALGYAKIAAEHVTAPLVYERKNND